VASEALRVVGVRHLLVFALVVILVGRFFREGLIGVLPWLLGSRATARPPAAGDVERVT
jgi:hypothetical protein